MSGLLVSLTPSLAVFDTVDNITMLHSQLLCEVFLNLAHNHRGGVEIACRGMDKAMAANASLWGAVRDVHVHLGEETNPFEKDQGRSWRLLGWDPPSKLRTKLASPYVFSLLWSTDTTLTSRPTFRGSR